MKKIIEALSCNNTGDDGKFTAAAMHQLAETAPGKPILHNFDRTKIIGRIDTAKVDENGNLWITGEIDEDFLKEAEGRGYIVPGFKVLESSMYDGKVTYKNVKAQEFGLTNNPIDKDLEIKVIQPELNEYYAQVSTPAGDKEFEIEAESLCDALLKLPGLIKFKMKDFDEEPGSDIRLRIWRQWQ